MLKMYQRRLHRGDSPSHWEENWGNTSFEEALRFCEHDPLHNLFEQYAPPGTVMLEGGCGLGQYVAHYAARGVRVVGLDFAQSTLRILRSRYAELMLCAGDVAALPFANGVFDVYYSGGVVEHFETGAGPALEEARRVLRPGGVLLISVPYVSLLRRVLSPFKSTLWKQVPRAQLDETEIDEGKQFFQYVYTRREFEKELAAVGLRVIGTQGYGILWGLYDIPLLQAMAEKLTNMHPENSSQLRSDTGDDQAAISESNSENGSEAQLETSVPGQASDSTLKRLILDEDDGIPGLGTGVRIMRWACANMMMYICQRCD